MPQSHYIPKEVVTVIIADPNMESDVYRVHFGQLGDHVMSLGSRARTTILAGDPGEARQLVEQAYGALRPYEDTRFSGLILGLRRHIQRIEKLF